MQQPGMPLYACIVWMEVARIAFSPAAGRARAADKNATGPCSGFCADQHCRHGVEQELGQDSPAPRTTPATAEFIDLIRTLHRQTKYLDRLINTQISICWQWARR